jgi:hypothetical protein
MGRANVSGRQRREKLTPAAAADLDKHCWYRVATGLWALMD